MILGLHSATFSKCIIKSFGENIVSLFFYKNNTHINTNNITNRNIISKIWLTCKIFYDIIVINGGAL